MEDSKLVFLSNDIAAVIKDGADVRLIPRNGGKEMILSFDRVKQLADAAGYCEGLRKELEQYKKIVDSYSRFGRLFPNSRL